MGNKKDFKEMLKIDENFPVTEEFCMTLGHLGIFMKSVMLFLCPFKLSAGINPKMKQNRS